MRKNTIKKLRLLGLVYSLGLGFCLPFTNAQSLHQKYSKQIEVQTEVSVLSNSPRSMSLMMSGTMESGTQDDGYYLSTGMRTKKPTISIKEYVVKSWDQNIIQQDVEVTVIPDEDSPSDAQALLDALKISFGDTGALLEIDANMNISKFVYKDTWFRGTNRSLYLENGKSYKIESIAIKTTLTIPKSSNLELTTNFVGVLLGDIDGKVTLNMEGANVQGGSIGTLDADLVFCKASFNKINKASINGHNAEFTAESVDQLEIGNRWFHSGADIGIYSESNNSALSKYQIGEVKRLTIGETVNDDFYFESVDNVNVSKSAFSNFIIKRLQNSLQMSARNGDITIQHIDKNFSSINLDNQVSRIELGLTEVDDYLIDIFNQKFIEIDFPTNLRSKVSSNRTQYQVGDSKAPSTISLKCNECVFKILDPKSNN